MAAGGTSLDRAYLVGIWLETIFYGTHPPRPARPMSLTHATPRPSAAQA